MSRPFPAHYGGRCAADCGEPIKAGDTVRFVDDVLAHADCAGQLDDELEHRRPEPGPCPSCWTVHAGECL